MQKPTALDDILRLAPSPCKIVGFQNDAGAGDDNSAGPVQKQPDAQPVETSPIREHVLNAQTTEDIDSPGILCRIGYLILRTVFYLAVLFILATAGLYAVKLAGAYDPCKEYYFTSDTKCTVTSYMKGVLHHVHCVEEQYCLLPGFWSNTSRQSWSLKEPVQVPEADSLSETIQLQSKQTSSFSS